MKQKELKKRELTDLVSKQDLSKQGFQEWSQNLDFMVKPQEGQKYMTGYICVGEYKGNKYYREV